MACRSAVPIDPEVPVIGGQGDIDPPSGAHSLPRAENGIRIDAKTIGLVLAVLLGSGGAGTVSSIVGGSGLKDEVGDLKRSVDGLRTDILSLKGDRAAAEIYRQRIEDHETRLRKLEEKIR